MTVRGILETCLYAADLKPAEYFYTRVLNLEMVSKEKNRHLFFKCGNTMLLIFNPHHTSARQSYAGGSPIPLHGTSGTGHLAFSVPEDEIPEWKERLVEHDIEIESEVEWPNGCHSLYFRDPAENSLELVSPAIWPL